jgi:subtilisin family serine protease
VLIAVIDTGMDYNHPDLRGGRVRTDIDRDFVNNDEDAMDDHGHGAFVAGIAAANTNNGQGIAGVCPGCQVLPITVLRRTARVRQTVEPGALSTQPRPARRLSA